METKIETRIDPYTREEFTQSRPNQKFATPKSKNDYHNRESRNRRLEEAKTLKPLRNNYKILKNLMKAENRRTFHMKYLEGAGFDFNFCTGIEKNGNDTYYSLFEFMWSKSNRNKNFVIVLKNGKSN